MTDRNFALVVAAYDDEDTAALDFRSLKPSDDVAVVAAVVKAVNEGDEKIAEAINS